MSRLRWFATVATLGLLDAVRATPTTAAPRLDVTAAPRIAIVSVEPSTTGGVRVIGQVTDQYTALALDQIAVRVRIDGLTVTRTTDGAGRFIVDTPSPRPPMAIEATLEATTYVAATSTRVNAPAVNRPMPVLQLAAALDGESLRVAITVEGVDDQGVRAQWPFELPVRLTATQGAQTLEIDRAMVGEGQFERQRLPQLGVWTLHAAFAGDARWAPSEASASVVIAGAGALTLRLAHATIPLNRYIEATGVISTADGNPIPRATVALRAGETRLATAFSDDQGRVAFRVPGSALPQGRHALSLALDIPLPYVEVAPAPLRWIEITGVSPQNWLSIAIAVMLTLLAVASVWWVERRWRRGFRAAAPAKPRSPGFAPMGPSLTARWRAPSQRAVQLRILDAATERPIAATVVARGADGDAYITCPEGRGTLTLPDGAYALHVQAPHYQGASRAIVIPHRGQWSDCAVYLVSMRDHAFELYAAAVAPLVEISPHVASPARVIATVRQALTQIPSARGPLQHMYADMESLTDMVERLYFGAVPPTPGDLSAIGNLAAAIAQHRIPVASPATYR